MGAHWLLLLMLRMLLLRLVLLLLLRWVRRRILNVVAGGNSWIHSDRGGRGCGSDRGRGCGGSGGDVWGGKSVLQTRERNLTSARHTGYRTSTAAQHRGEVDTQAVGPYVLHRRHAALVGGFVAALLHTSHIRRCCFVLKKSVGRAHRIRCLPLKINQHAFVPHCDLLLSRLDVVGWAVDERSWRVDLVPELLTVDHGELAMLDWSLEHFAGVAVRRLVDLLALDLRTNESSFVRHE